MRTLGYSWWVVFLFLYIYICISCILWYKPLIMLHAIFHITFLYVWWLESWHNSFSFSSYKWNWERFCLSQKTLCGFLHLTIKDKATPHDTYNGHAACLIHSSFLLRLIKYKMSCCFHLFWILVMRGWGDDSNCNGYYRSQSIHALLRVLWWQTIYSCHL